MGKISRKFIEKAKKLLPSTKDGHIIFEDVKEDIISKSPEPSPKKLLSSEKSYQNLISVLSSGSPISACTISFA